MPWFRPSAIPWATANVTLSANAPDSPTSGARAATISRARSKSALVICIVMPRVCTGSRRFSSHTQLGHTSALGQMRTSVPYYSRDGGYDDPSTGLAKERDEGSVTAELSRASMMLRPGPHEGTGNDQTHAR